MTDILRVNYIKSIGSLLVSLIGSSDTRYAVEVIDVETGLMRINVSGKSQETHMNEVWSFFDWDGNEYEPATFYTDYEAEEQQP